MSTSTTPDVEKIAREAAEKIDYYQQDGEMGVPSLTKILRPYLAQAREPFATANLRLVKALEVADKWLRYYALCNAGKRPPEPVCESFDKTWATVRDALTGTEEKI